MILVDTNILLRMAQPSHTQFPSAIKSVEKLEIEQKELCILPQVIYEFWVVATRPLQLNGLGMTPDTVESNIWELIENFNFLRDERAIFFPWLDLVSSHQVLGKQAHDARLVAAMQRHDLTHILTFNVADFARYPGITVLDPQQVAATS